MQREAGHLFRVSRPALKFLPTSRNWLSVIDRVSGAQYNYAANDVNSYYATSSKFFFFELHDFLLDSVLLDYTAAIEDAPGRAELRQGVPGSRC